MDARDVVKGAIEQGEKLARTRRLTFVVDLPEDSLPIRADADALRRAILILIDNAVKYTPEGGRITVGLHRKDGRAVAFVTDTGIGIAPEDLPHIFDRFWRTDKARSREGGGAGLGLSIAKWIVDTHGGSIAVESDIGKGSTFSILIALQ
jgi:signal transduction histidine kinase